ncbi:Acyl carrier protein (ACP1) [hydrothermal vent metagenome]|uniref:Acyl carrier protein (ACP1) n=1 Tax=hydrothermal vent metagenome TaxID=652676 RepID=A0A3B0ZGH3_9ZZZZ
MSGSQHSGRELEVAALIVEALNLEDISAAEIEPEAPLFREGLGLDSIDALEIAMAISQKYGFQLRSDDPDNATIFSTLRQLSEHIEKNKQ